jgi:formamidopyrimidine-DNA glycosylase
MPELPDLQVFSHNLKKKLKGKKLEKINVPAAKNINVPVAKLQAVLKGQTIKDIYREGKELHFQFSKGDKLGLHLMLHGDLFLFENKNEHKHTIIELIFYKGLGLALTDWQGMARPTLNPEVKRSPDALSKELNGSYLKKALSATKTPIKTFLMDQNKIRGIGNAYADEILWDAGISPFSVSNKIPAVAVSKLARSIKKVLKNAEKKILRTNPDIITGEVRNFLFIHNASKKESPTGRKIQVKAGARKTYYTDEQVLYK